MVEVIKNVEIKLVQETNNEKFKEYSEKIIRGFLFDEKTPSMPKFKAIYKLIKDFQYLTKYTTGTTILTLLYIEQAINFSNDYCYCEEDIEDAVSLAVDDLKKIFDKDASGEYRMLLNNEILKIYNLAKNSEDYFFEEYMEEKFLANTMSLKDRYTYPYSQILELGEVWDIANRNDWEETKVAYEKFNFTEIDIPTLIKIFEDKDFNDVAIIETEAWAPIHALILFGVLKSNKAVKPILKMFEQMDDLDNDMWQWLPRVVGAYGEEFIGSMKKFLYDKSKDEISRSVAGESLVQIVQNYPKQREKCVNILTDFLKQANKTTPALNDLVVNYLVDLNAIEKIDIIKRAFEREIFDVQGFARDFRDFEDVEVAFGIKEKRTKPYPWVKQFIKHVKIGRNDLCPCGSGKKFKKCCLGNGKYD